MTLAEHYRAMARNNAWSNYRLHNACRQLTQEAFTAERVSFFPSIQLTLHHNLIVDWYYIDAITEGGRGYDVHQPAANFPTLDSIAGPQTKSDKHLIAICDGLSDADLDRQINLLRRTPVPPERIGYVLTHLFVHQLHHRGQAHAMLAGTEVAPPQLDEFFLVGDAPRNRDELAALGISRAA